MCLPGIHCEHETKRFPVSRGEFHGPHWAERENYKRTEEFKEVTCCHCGRKRQYPVMNDYIRF